LTRIALCIPVNGPPTWALLDSIARFQAYHYHEHPEVMVDVIRPPRALPVDLARNYLAKVALEQGHDYLWFCDQDAAFVPQTLDRLMSWDAPIVGALCMIRGATHCMPMVFRGYNPKTEKWPNSANDVHEYMRRHYDVMTNDPQILDPIPANSLFRVDFTGCHCLLIKREVLEQLEMPWFSGLPGQEDRNFCLKADKNEIPVHVDFSVLAGHATGARIIGAWDFIAHYRLLAEHTEGWNGRNETKNRSELHLSSDEGDSGARDGWVRWTR